MNSLDEGRLMSESSRSRMSGNDLKQTLEHELSGFAAGFAKMFDDDSIFSTDY